MKTLRTILILTTICVQGCYAQKTKKIEINFSDLINLSSRSIGLGECKLDDTLTIPYFRSGFDIYTTNKKGSGIFFFIPKSEFGVWKKEDKSGWKREEVWKNSQAKIQSAREFLSFSKDTLVEYFDLYVFYIKQSDIVFEGTVMSDEGELLEDYYVKDGAIVFTYKYESGVWIEINEKKSKDGNIKTFGQEVVKKILQERFRDEN